MEKGTESNKDNGCLTAVVESVAVVERDRRIKRREEEVMASAAPGYHKIQNKSKSIQ